MTPMEIGLAIGGFVAALVIIIGGEMMGTSSFSKIGKFIKKLFGKQKSKIDTDAYTRSEFEAFIQFDLRLQQLITELRLETKAHRSHVFLFHNGGKYASEMSIRKFSCTHESVEVSAGIVNIHDRQNFLISAFPDKMEKILNPAYDVYIVDDLGNGPFKNYMRTLNSYAFSADSLKYNNIMVGFVGLHWGEDAVPKDEKEFNLFVENYRMAIEKYKPLIEDALVRKFDFYKNTSKNKKEFIDNK